MATHTERDAPPSGSVPRRPASGWRALALALALATGGCRGEAEEAETEPEGWAVTAWGERYELYQEVEPLVAGAAASAHAHVTLLDGFAPLTEGKVEIVLRGAGGEQVFGAT